MERPHLRSLRRKRGDDSLSQRFDLGSVPPLTSLTVLSSLSDRIAAFHHDVPPRPLAPTVSGDNSVVWNQNNNMLIADPDSLCRGLDEQNLETITKRLLSEVHIQTVEAYAYNEARCPECKALHPENYFSCAYRHRRKCPDCEYARFGRVVHDCYWCSAIISKTCCICYTMAVDVSYPCGHFQFCARCVREDRKSGIVGAYRCPVCRARGDPVRVRWTN